MYKPEQPKFFQSDVNNRFLSRPNEGIQFGNGQEYSGGAIGSGSFDNSSDEDSYWANDKMYQEMLAEVKRLEGLNVPGQAEPNMNASIMRNQLLAKMQQYRQNKFNVPKLPAGANAPTVPTTSPTPAPAATPTSPAFATKPASTPPATSAPTPTPATPASNPGFMTSPQGAPAVTASSSSTQNTPASQPAKTGLSADQISELKRRYEDALQMPLPTDPRMAQQQREYIANLKKELERAMLGAMDQTVPAGMGAGIPILQAREAAVRADNIVRAERQKVKDDHKAQDVLKQAKEHYKGDTNSPEFKAWLKEQGYAETGHKFKENMFDKAARQKAEDPKGQNPNNFTPAQIEAIKTQRAKELEPKPTTGMDTVKSQLKQMLDAGFIDEATFRNGMNDPYSQARTIQAIYDQYVKRFNPHPNSPFPNNSA